MLNNIDQHPADLLNQMECRIRGGESFISTFYFSKKFGWLSESVKVYSDGRESLWIFGKKKIPMFLKNKLTNPYEFLQKKESLKQQCKKLQILKKAYKGTDKLGVILEEIEEIESTYHLGIDEIILKK